MSREGELSVRLRPRCCAHLEADVELFLFACSSFSIRAFTLFLKGDKMQDNDGFGEWGCEDLVMEALSVKVGAVA